MAHDYEVVSFCVDAYLRHVRSLGSAIDDLAAEIAEHESRLSIMGVSYEADRRQAPRRRHPTHRASRAPLRRDSRRHGHDRAGSLPLPRGREPPRPLDAEGGRHDVRADCGGHPHEHPYRAPLRRARQVVALPGDARGVASRPHPERALKVGHLWPPETRYPVFARQCEKQYTCITRAVLMDGFSYPRRWFDAASRLLPCVRKAPRAGLRKMRAVPQGRCRARSP